MLDAGEDPLYLARRVVRMAVEDIGLADPQALVIANAAKDAYDFLGCPEGELAIAEAVIYVATAPKSNATYVAFGEAMRTAKEAGSLLPPKHILNAPTKLMKTEGYGSGYEYDHDARGGVFRPGLFPRSSSAAGSSTIRPSAALSARSGSGWNTGPSCGASGAAREKRSRTDGSPAAASRLPGSQASASLPFTVTLSAAPAKRRQEAGAMHGSAIQETEIGQTRSRAAGGIAPDRSIRSRRGGVWHRRRPSGVDPSAAHLRMARTQSRRAGSNADQRPERRRHRRRSRHAGRPLSRGAVSGPELLPYPARHP